MKKRGWLILIVICTVLIGGIVGRLLWKPDPTELLIHGLEQLNQATSFRYSMTQHQWVEGKDRILTQILGEKDGGNTRISGQLVGTEVEMIVAGEGFYLRDTFSKRWVRYPSVPATQEVFLAELNPKSSLQFKEYGEVSLSGEKKINDQKTWVLEFKPSIQNQIMEEGWTDFSYTVFIGKKDKQIYQVIIEAKNKMNNQPMTMTLEFKDYGKKITIEAPKL